MNTPTVSGNQLITIIAICDTSAGDRLKENVLKRLMPAVFGDRTEGAVGIAEAAFAAVALARELPIYSETEVKNGPVRKTVNEVIQGRLKMPGAKISLSTPEGYNTGADTNLPPINGHNADAIIIDDPLKGAERTKFTDPLPAKKEKAPPSPDAGIIEQEGVTYKTLSRIAQECECNAISVFHRATKLKLSLVANGTGKMLRMDDAKVVIDSLTA